MSTRLAHGIGCEGKVLHFRYRGGSTPGRYRLVYVFGYKGIGKRTLQCWDFDKQEPRCFCQGKMDEIVRLEDSVRIVNLANLPSTIDGEDIARGYEQEGYDTYNDDDVVVAVKRKKACVKHEYFRGGTTLRATGPRGTSLALTMDDRTNTVSLEIRSPGNIRTMCKRNPSPTQLRDALNRVIDG